MPEGPEVRIVTDWLQSNFKGRSLRASNPIGWNEKSRYSKDPRGYHYITDLIQITIKNIICKGKQIFFCLEGLTFQGQTQLLYINSFLGMEGKWLSSPLKHSDLWLNTVSTVYDQKLSNINITRERLYFDDSRHMGLLTVLTEDGYMNKLNKIGPDLLSENVDLFTWMDVLSRKRLRNKQICDFLLEQKYFSGIGNYLKSEILYECKIRPDRPLGELTDSEKESLLIISTQKIRYSYSCGGLTIKSFYSPDGKTGIFPVKVYNKSLDPNGNEVITSKFKDCRTSHWVPLIQL